MYIYTNNNIILPVEHWDWSLSFLESNWTTHCSRFEGWILLAIDDAKVQDLVSGHSVLFEYLQQVLGFSVNSALIPSFDIIRIQNNKKMILVILNFLQISHMIKSCQYINFFSNLLHFYPGHIGQQWKSPENHNFPCFSFNFPGFLWGQAVGFFFQEILRGCGIQKRTVKYLLRFYHEHKKDFKFSWFLITLKPFYFLPVIHSCCRILQYFMIFI